MGRKSLADIRRREILDAFEVCISTLGFHQSSTRKIAEQAGVKQPVIAHYFGSKAAMIEALVARIETYYLTRFSRAVEDCRGDQRLERALAFMFGPQVLGPEAAKIPLGALIAAARNNADLKSQILRMYNRFLSVCHEELKRAVPNATDRAVHQTAYGLLSLGIGNDILGSTQKDFVNRDTALASAHILVQKLKSGL